jgi:hypothetical protein
MRPAILQWKLLLAARSDGMLPLSIGGEAMVATETGERGAGRSRTGFADFIQRNDDVEISLGILLIAVIQWVKFLFATKPVLQDPVNIGLISVSVIMPVIMLIIFLKKGANGWAVAIMFVNALLAVVGAFAWIYWDAGNIHNFSVKLSHLDAVYFTLGTLTTGSGNIFARSEYSRAVQTIQLVCDLALMGFAAGVVFARFADYLKKR